MFGIPDAPPISHTVIHLFSSSNADKITIRVSLIVVEGWPVQASSSISLLPRWNHLNHRTTVLQFRLLPFSHRTSKGYWTKYTFRTKLGFIYWDILMCTTFTFSLWKVCVSIELYRYISKRSVYVVPWADFELSDCFYHNGNSQTLSQICFQFRIIAE